mmetsp:Transcript_40766/g.76296  ORF Transcript_40766/g.76296 Transcript_40766/m.76296 type:complete len:281 (+) Transcript_40766:240-1082(+)
MPQLKAGERLNSLFCEHKVFAVHSTFIARHRSWGFAAWETLTWRYTCMHQGRGEPPPLPFDIGNDVYPSGSSHGVQERCTSHARNYRCNAPNRRNEQSATTRSNQHARNYPTSREIHREFGKSRRGNTDGRAPESDNDGFARTGSVRPLSHEKHKGHVHTSVQPAMDEKEEGELEDVLEQHQDWNFDNSNLYAASSYNAHKNRQIDSDRISSSKATRYRSRRTRTRKHAETGECVDYKKKKLWDHEQSQDHDRRVAAEESITYATSSERWVMIGLGRSKK